MSTAAVAFVVVFPGILANHAAVQATGAAAAAVGREGAGARSQTRAQLME